jgi:hypothetical protein
VLQEVVDGSGARLEVVGLHIPADWSTPWDRPNENQIKSDGKSRLTMFKVLNEQGSFSIDVELIPSTNHRARWKMYVLRIPVRCRSLENGKIVFTHSNSPVHTLHRFSTRSADALIDEIQHWIWRCNNWSTARD